MPELKGELLKRASGYAVRVVIQNRTRKVFPLAPRGEESARARAVEVSEMAALLRRHQLAHTSDGMKLLELAAIGNKHTLKAALRAAEKLINGELEDVVSSAPSFADVAKEWTSGDLAKKYEDHVRLKNSKDDTARLKFVCEIDLGGIKFGDVPIDKIRIEHCEAVMRSLPATARRPATRRHYAQVISRVLQLAAFPMRLIEKSPLPKGFLPRVGKPPAYPYLYPEDDRKLLACIDVPMGRRIYWGWVMREGGRKGETARLQVSDFDLKRGVVRVDENKTDDPRSWVMSPGVADALRAWVAIRGLRQSDRMFSDADRSDFIDESQTARLLRADLKTAGVTTDRPELLVSTATRGRIRMHDLRGTFVTLSLAAGQSETWVADRTGHKSSIMINRYRRRAREVSELGLGALGRLDRLIPGIADWLDSRPDSAHGSRPPPPRGSGPDRDSSIFNASAEAQTRTGTPLRATDFESTASGAGSRTSEETASRDREQTRENSGAGQDMGGPDAVEEALAAALDRASLAGRWDTVAQLSRELQIRRESRLGVVELDSLRRGTKAGGKS